MISDSHTFISITKRNNLTFSSIITMGAIRPTKYYQIRCTSETIQAELPKRFRHFTAIYKITRVFFMLYHACGGQKIKSKSKVIL